MTISSFGFCLFLLFIYIYHKWRIISKVKAAQSTVEPEKIKGNSVPELPKSKSIKSALLGSSQSSILDEAKSVLERAEELSDSSEEDDYFDEKEILIKDSVLENLVQTNRLRHRGRSVLG
jgi:hypothetical protein